MDVLHFGTLTVPDAVGRRDVELASMRSSALHVGVLTFGATLHAVEAPDRHGHPGPVSLSMPILDDYRDRARNAYVGATCGRWANRIRNATFELDGRRVVVEANDGPHHLHGGPDGFSRRVWDLVEASDHHDGGRVVLALRSPAGDQGFPGELTATATFELHGHTLRVAYEATTRAPTVVNLTNHAYWNLAGAERWHEAGSVADHQLRVPADEVLPADAASLPNGPLTPVAGTTYDLRHGPLVGDLLEHHPAGIDHSYAVPHPHVDDHGPVGMHLAAELQHHGTGRTLSITTDQPALHVYTANRLGPPFAPRAAICLETQRFPDAPNRTDGDRGVLRPGDRYHSVTDLTFGTLE